MRDGIAGRVSDDQLAVAQLCKLALDFDDLSWREDGTILSQLSPEGGTCGQSGPARLISSHSALGVVTFEPSVLQP